MDLNETFTGLLTFHLTYGVFKNGSAMWPPPIRAITSVRLNL